MWFFTQQPWYEWIKFILNYLKIDRSICTNFCVVSILRKPYSNHCSTFSIALRFSSPPANTTYVSKTHLHRPGGGGGGGGGHSSSEVGHTRVMYFAEERVFFKTSACPRFCKRRVLFCTQVRSMGVENPLTIHEIYAALTPSVCRSDWASESAAAKQAENYNFKS